MPKRTEIQDLVPVNCSSISWLAPPDVLTLENDEIHVWRISFDTKVAQVKTLYHLLASDELKRADRFYLQKDRDRFITARGTLRIILGKYLRLDPQDVRFFYGPNGKPMLTEKDGMGLCFNISHSHDNALYAFTYGRRIGVDTEYICCNQAIMDIVERFFTFRELTIIQSYPLSMRHEAFFNLWTCKEAFLKAAGTGLSFDLNKVEVSARAGEPVRLVSINGDSREASLWSLIRLDTVPRYASALAVEGCNLHLKCWQKDTV
jgi:4'-phosphopantetheinyl transferase